MSVRYTRVGWQDAPSTDTPIDAANLNHMDNGILALSEEVDTELPLLQEQINDISTDIDTQIDEKVPPEVSSWLTEHVDPVGSAVVVDDSLTIQGAAADAKKTGDEISDLKDGFNSIADSYGFDNNFDESGYILNGVDASASNYVRTSEYYDCSTWSTIYVRRQNTDGATLVLYNAQKEFLSNEGLGTDKNIAKPSNASFYRVYRKTGDGLLYISNIAPSDPVNFSKQYAIKDTALINLFAEQRDSANAFDSDFDASGYILNGNDASASAFVRTSKYYNCSTWDYIFVRHEEGTAEGFTLVLYDASKGFVSNVGSGDGINLKRPANVSYFRVYKRTGTGKSYISEIIPDDFADFNYASREMILEKYADVTRPEFLVLKSRVFNSADKTIVNFGDSIIGNTQDDTSVSGILSALSGFNCINAGFGGCRMSLHDTQGWDAFSMCELADAIVTNDWTKQDNAISQASTLNLPSYFATTLAKLKTIDFEDVYMITIEYGTNDWSGGVNPLDNSEDKEDKDTYAGALRYTINKLQTAYPAIKIVVQNPVVRINPTTGETSDTVTNALGLTLPQYVDAENNACKEFKIPVVDAYYKSGFNIYNHDYYFSSSSEDVHLGYNGRYRVAEMIASFILSNYR